MSSLPDLRYLTVRVSASEDTVAITVEKKYGGNFRLGSRFSWVAAGFMAGAMERARSIFLVLRDIVLYAGPSVGSVGGGGVVFLVQLHVHAAIGLSSLSLSMSELFMRLGMLFCTLINVISISGTLVDGGMSTCVCGGGGIYVIYTLGYGCSFTCTYVRVKMWGCLVGAVLLESSSCCLIKLLASVESCSGSRIDIYPSPLDIHLADFLRLRMDLTTRLTCVIVGFVIFLCWKTTVSDTRLVLVLLNLYTW